MATSCMCFSGDRLFLIEYHGIWVHVCVACGYMCVWHVGTCVCALSGDELHVLTYMYIYIHTYIHTYIYIYIYMRVCIYIYRSWIVFA
jgi:hypothetical protein